MRKYLTLALWIAGFEAVSALIGRATQTGVNSWYTTLTAPPLTPPNIIFPVVWTILYAMIAAAGWTLWRQRSKKKAHLPLLLFVFYMALNWSWSFVFFGAHLLLAGFLWILALNIVAIALILLSWQRQMRTATLLMIPPTLWTLFAAYLNGGYWWLNS